MLELLAKIRARKFLFLLLIAPLLFTPVGGQRDGWDRYYGIALGGPFLSLPEVLIWEADWEDVEDHMNHRLFIDWGRIAYWELWVLLTYFCIVPWFHNVPKRLFSYLRSGKLN